VPVLERRHGLRVVAEAAALDAAAWTGDDVLVLRLAPDEALALGATRVEVSDPHAIVEDEAGFAVAPVALDVISAHIEWALPTERPALAQGSVAGIPARLWLTGDDAMVIVHAAYAADLQDRLR
jgi:hypothetical protein